MVVWCAAIFPTVLLGQLSLSVSAGLAGEVGEPAPTLPSREPGPYTVAKDAANAFDEAFGAGVNTHLRLNYAFSRHLAADLDLSIFSSLSQSRKTELNGEVEMKTQLNSPRLLVNPGISLSTGWRVFAPYLRLGVLLPGYQPIRIQREIRSDTDLWVRDVRINSQTTFGVSGSLGFTYQVGDRIRLFYEMELRNHSARLKKAEVLTYQHNEMELLPELIPYQRQAEFFRELPVDANQASSPNFDPNRPEQLRTRDKSLRQMTSNLGIIIRLN
ncbi:MAG: hypothetical protein AAF399_13870 [Bacteroidota bacterium]